MSKEGSVSLKCGIWSQISEKHIRTGSIAERSISNLPAARHYFQRAVSAFNLPYHVRILQFAFKHNEKVVRALSRASDIRNPDFQLFSRLYSSRANILFSRAIIYFPNISRLMSCLTFCTSKYFIHFNWTDSALRSRLSMLHELKQIQDSWG